MPIHDLIGIGFGPSNLALAIALHEQKTSSGMLHAVFIERQPAFAWHPDMLLDHAHMQISFLKDLATLRNPSSPFTFLNYLHEKERLHDFINLKTFYPSRHEFNDYLTWAASHFESICAYGEEVIEVLPQTSGPVISLLRVRSRRPDGSLHERLTRSLVIGVGGAPNIPPCFHAFAQDGRIFHSSRYLRELARQTNPRRVAVIGAGQSAAEIFLDLHNRGLNVDLVMRARAIKPSDDSPFVNEIFNPEFTDHFFGQPDDQRTALIEEFLNTNYAAPDLVLIEQIYNVLYQQKVGGTPRHRFLRRHEVTEAAAEASGISMGLTDLDSGKTEVATYDAIVLATGYLRNTHETILQPIADRLGDLRVDRTYRVQTAPQFEPAIFLQGCCETTHGLSDTLLSVIAIRTEEIGQSLRAALRKEVAEMENTSHLIAAQ
jgi:L-ornithine N5-oxygenase